MKVESFFTIGHRHIDEGIPCEDYAMSENISGSFFGAISDGCSGANANTDIGARIWCLSASSVMYNNAHYENILPENFTQQLIKEFKNNNITKSNQDCIASLIVLAANKEQAKIWIMGDGGYALKHNNGDITLYCYKWLDNTPLYPIYLLDNNVIKGFQKKHQHSGNAFTLTKTRFVFNSNDKLIIKEHSSDQHYWEDMKNGMLINIDRVKQDVSDVVIVSDGLWSFSNVSPFMVIDFCLSTEDNELLKKHMVDVLEYLQKHKAKNKDDFSLVKLKW